MRKILFLAFLACNFVYSQLGTMFPCSISSAYTTNEIECNRFQFTAASISNNHTDIIGYHWFFGDGTEATGKVVTHEYSTNGTYEVLLTTIGKSETECCSTTECFTVTVACTTPPPPPPPPVDDCGYILGINVWAPLGDCIVMVDVNGLHIDNGWYITNYKWHFSHTATGQDITEYGAPPLYVDLTDYNSGPWTITLEITATTLTGETCIFSYTRNYDSGCAMDRKPETSITIYPNPSQEFINIETNNIIDTFRVEIIDYNGKTLDNLILPKENYHTIPIKNIPQGIYHIKIYRNDEVIKTERFIKK